MRLAKPLELDRISQVLAKGTCPICAFLKNDQAARNVLPDTRSTFARACTTEASPTHR